MTPAGDWRYVCASVPGVSHLSAAVECQDASAACLLSAASMPENGPLLLLVAADGAGSAAQARAGADLACHILLDALINRLVAAAPADWSASLAATLLDSVRSALERQAAAAELPLRDYACTLLGAAVAADRALALQIGDGAIIIGNEDGYRPVFWPQTGQYANETRFVTDPDAGEHLQCVILAEPVKEIALLTDGLQPLALHYQSRRAHGPFFRPLFQQLGAVPEAGCSDALVAALERFLDSPTVNQRTHDDKTLLLATRLEAWPDTNGPGSPRAAATGPAGSESEDDAFSASPAESTEPDRDPDAAIPEPVPRTADGSETV